MAGRCSEWQTVTGLIATMKASPVVSTTRRVAKRVLPQSIQSRLRDLRAESPGIPLVPVHELERAYRRAVGYLRDGTPYSVGDYLEFGVYRGDSLLCMARVRRALGLTFRLVGFDSFEGLPSLQPGDESLGWSPGWFRSSYARTRRRLRKAGLGRDEAILVKGWFDKTLTSELIRTRNLEKASTIMIDCDLYSSTRTALEFCAPLIRDETIVFLDDWDGGKGLADRGEGEARAFAEFLELHPEFEADPFDSYRHKELDPPPISKVFLVRRIAEVGGTVSRQHGRISHACAGGGAEADLLRR